eukprot:Rhum_TRINITY_DN12113_c0_g1::Rhum_TRINITY_DN12113_c0_g1_i1::g.49399::m.49399
MVTRVLALLCVCVGASAYTQTLTCRGTSYLLVDGLVCPYSTIAITDATLESCAADFCPSLNFWARAKGGKKMILNGQDYCTVQATDAACQQQICRHTACPQYQSQCGNDGCYWINGTCSSIKELGGGMKPGRCPVDLYSSPCEYVNCLVKPQDVCGLPQAGSSSSMFAYRSCLWTNGRCHASVTTAELPSNLAKLFAPAVEDAATGLRQCAVSTMSAEGLTSSRSDFGCGPAVLSPDCVDKVSVLGNLVQQCAKTTLKHSAQAYYDTELAYIADGTKEVYDCTAEEVKTCAFSTRAGGFCGPARRVKWEVPSTADAQACLADYNCLAEAYNRCAKQKAFVP